MEATFWKRWRLPLILLAIFPLTIVLPMTGIIDPYVDLVLKYVGINIILTISLNLVNGYMGEFSVGHAGFMAIGAYVASILTVWLFPPGSGAFLFPVALLAGGIAAGIAGLGLAFPSFRTRGDYLAIVTLAFNMIIKSVLENVEAIGGPRGFMGMDKLTSLAWVYVVVIVAVFLARNFVFSNFGRGVLSIREDEIASGLVSVRTRQVKVLTFVFSAFLAGVAGGLFAHELQFINPRSFTILKSTDMLVMVYLGGIGSIGGSILGATVFTVVLEGLRTVLQQLGISQEWRLVVAPLLLILLMLYRPRGLFGLREFRFLIPRDEQSEAFDETRRQVASAKEVAP
ncbi:MAG TPA: branched-chain amino acid ABC transporter permease [Anaerolineae bacterium]|nr:branched-chain amino acid ABC transporter permease [Anaerolineae bacterium]